MTTNLTPEELADMPQSKFGPLYKLVTEAAAARVKAMRELMGLDDEGEGDDQPAATRRGPKTKAEKAAAARAALPTERDRQMFDAARGIEDHSHSQAAE